MNTSREIQSIIDLALQEDIRTGDITTRATVSPATKGRARIVSKASGITAGTAAAVQVFRQVDRSLKIRVRKKDGSRVRRNDCIMTVEGKLGCILQAERTALNFLQRLSGIATMTGAYVSKLKGFKTRIIDTRKTTPGMRALEKLAVRAGGGGNHRLGLYDMFLVKDNHIDQAGGVGAALRRVREWKRKHKNRCRVEVEVRDLAEVREALPFKPDWIMLDNMPLSVMKKAIVLIRKKAPRTRIEASGNLTLGRIRSVARTGVDFISAGVLTHSVPALDISLII